MNKVTTYMLLLAAMFTFAACHHQPDLEAAVDSSPNYPQDVQQVLTPVHLAWDDTTSFGRECRNTFQIPDPVRAFTIRAEDLLAALNLPTSIVNLPRVHKFVRVYLGYNKDAKAFKLFIIPVRGADLSNKDKSYWKYGEDLFLDSTGKVPNDFKKKDIQGLFVLDLNAPCPTTCPVGLAVKP